MLLRVGRCAHFVCSSTPYPMGVSPTGVYTCLGYASRGACNGPLPCPFPRKAVEGTLNEQRQKSHNRYSYKLLSLARRGRGRERGLGLQFIRIEARQSV